MDSLVPYGEQRRLSGATNEAVGLVNGVWLQKESCSVPTRPQQGLTDIIGSQGSAWFFSRTVPPALESLKLNQVLAFLKQTMR